MHQDSAKPAEGDSIKVGKQVMFEEKVLGLTPVVKLAFKGASTRYFTNFCEFPYLEKHNINV